MSILKGRKSLEAVKSVHFTTVSALVLAAIEEEKSEYDDLSSTSSENVQGEPQDKQNVKEDVLSSQQISPVVIVTPDQENEEGDSGNIKVSSTGKRGSVDAGNVHRKSSDHLKLIKSDHGNSSVSELSTATSAETDVSKGKKSGKKTKRRKSNAGASKRRSSLTQNIPIKKPLKSPKPEKNVKATDKKASTEVTNKVTPSTEVTNKIVPSTEVKVVSSFRANHTPTPTSFDTVSTVTQRKKNRMEDLIQNYADPDHYSPDYYSASPSSPHQLHTSPNALTQRFGNVFRASRVWDKGEDDVWERRRVRCSDSDNSLRSSTSVSDSGADDFSLAKVPIKKTKSSLYAPNVINVLYNLEVMKKKRKKKSIRDQVKSIKERVYQALKNVDMHLNSSDEEEEANMRLPSIFPAVKQREEEKRRSKILEGTIRYVGECNHRYQIISEVNDWISDPSSLADGMIPDEEMEMAMVDYEDIHENVIQIVNQFSDTSEEVVKLGGQLLKEASNIIKENELQAKKMQSKTSDFNIVYDERALLSDPVKWDNAIKMILQTLNDALKWTKNANHKHLYGKCSKQFRNLSVAMGKKELELKEKRKTVEDLKTKMNMAKAAAEKQVKEMDEIKKVVRRMSVDVEEKKNLLAQYEEKNKTLMRKLQQYESQMKTLQAEIETRIVEKTVTVTQEIEAANKKPKKPPPAPG
ncbi:uncharacterized protein PF3D7_1120000-like [Argopecten irradians]|uniref:uncharacterized protein PF3D7_1120000-like n=1 Tax=Argopecten irradians TaxID=31199 RepID=UPI003713FFD5